MLEAARNVKAPGGWIARTDPEGKSFTCILQDTKPLRYCFNKDEMFTYDSDMEWDSGNPGIVQQEFIMSRVVQSLLRTGTGKFPSGIQMFFHLL